MREYFEEGGYDQKIEFNEFGVYDVTCTCNWGTTYSDNWRKGEKVCKHITKVIKKFVTEKLKYETK